MLENRPTIEAGHRRVEDHEVELLVGLEEVDRLVAIIALEDLVAVSLEQRARERASIFIVIHQQDARWPFRLLLGFCIERLAENALHFNERRAPLLHPLQPDGVQTPHTALFGDTRHRRPTFALLDGLLDSRTHDEHFIHRQAPTVSGKAAFGTSERAHDRLLAVAVRKALLVRRELATNRLGAGRAHAPQ